MSQNKEDETKPLIYNDKEYSSLEDIALEYNISPVGIKNAMKQGMSLESAVSEVLSFPKKGKTLREPPKQEVTYKGVTYATAKEFCDAYEILWKDIMYLTSVKGFDFDTAVEMVISKRKRLTYNGKYYKSLRILAKELGVNYNTLYSKVSAGETLEYAVNKYLAEKDKNSVTYKGTKYSTLSKLLKELNIPYPFVYGRMRYGATLESAIELYYESKRK